MVSRSHDGKLSRTDSVGQRVGDRLLVTASSDQTDIAGAGLVFLRLTRAERVDPANRHDVAVAGVARGKRQEADESVLVVEADGRELAPLMLGVDVPPGQQPNRGAKTGSLAELSSSKRSQRSRRAASCSVWVITCATSWATGSMLTA
jgi:hypothetical protein